MKCLIIKHKVKKEVVPIVVCELSDIQPLEFLKLKKEASENLESLLERNQKVVDSLQEQINELKHEVKILKGEE